MVLVVSATQAQNVFNINDPDSIFTATNQPPAPAWGKLAKWGHTHRLTWPGTGTTTFKSYYFDGMQFRLKFPHTYQQGVSDGKLYPLFIFFHGEGEAGTIYDNEYQMFHGGQIVRDWIDNGTFDGFAFFYQSTNGYAQSEFAQISSVIDSLVKYAKVDPNRICLNGLSSGGQGEWDYFNYDPKRVATAIIFSAARNEYIPVMPNYVQIPIWELNGGKDNNPDTATARNVITAFRNLGGNITQTVYPTLGHDTWDAGWADPNFVPTMLAGYKSNPLLYFQKSNFCPGQPINAKMGLVAGFAAYQWALNGQVIPGATSNIYTATALGSYTARFQRADGTWSDWSHTPVVLTSGAVSQTPPITVNGLHSIVLPAPDGSTKVPLTEPTGYASYQWLHLPDSAVVSTINTDTAGPGQYIAQATSANACSSLYSTVFTVVNANASGGPDPATNLGVLVLSSTSLQLNWSKNPHPNIPETGFEIYRATKSGGPYTYLGINDNLSYTDNGLLPGTAYYYIVRAVNGSAAAKSTNEATATTSADVTPPTAPSGLALLSATGNSISVKWTASTDNVGVVYYDIFVNGQKAYTIPAPAGTTITYTVNNLTASQIYNIQVAGRDIAGNESPFSNQITAAAVNIGLNYNYYTTTSAWSKLPNFNTLTPVSTGAINNVNLTIVPATQTTNYGLIWTGFLNVRKAGTYTLETNSDDGSDLWLGSLNSTNPAYNPSGTPLVNNDGQHGAQSKTANVNLQVGSYPIAFTYFQGGGGASMNIFWTCTSCGIARSAIPDSAFAANQGLGAAPAAPSNVVATALAYNSIGLTWKDNSSNETGFDIYRATSSGGPYNTVGQVGQGITSYTDNTGSPNTKYYYEVQALGQYGQSALSGSANATTKSLPAAPKAPVNLSASAANTYTINLNWSDTSNDATTFQVYRSTTDQTNYRLIATVNNGGGTAFSYTDSSLFDNVLYYYQVYGVNAGGQGAASNAASATTPLNNPVIAPVPNFSMRYNSIDTIQLSVTDKDNSPITLSATQLPAFGALTDNGNGTGQIVFSPAASDSGSYTVIVAANAANGGVASATFQVAVNNNHQPVLNPISPAAYKAGTTDTLQLIANDSDGNAGLIYSATNLPSFATLTDNGNGSATVIFKPTFSSGGTYSINFTVTDPLGAFSTKTLALTVTKVNPNQNIYVRMQYGYAVGAPWNNMTGPVLNNLKASDGTQTAVGVSFSNPSWWNTYNQGPQTGNNSGVYPDSVELEYYYFGIYGGPSTVNDTISGLRPGGKYNLKFYAGSASPLVANAGTTVYTIGSQAVPLLVQNNSANTANFNQVAADSTGRIVVNMSMAQDGVTPAGFLNAFEIDYFFNDSTPPAQPNNLTATLVPKGVQLNWNDPAYNATAYQVWRATDTTQPFTLLDSGNVNPNLVSWLDSTVNGHTTYYYKLKSVNQYGDNGFTPTVSIATLSRVPTVSAIANPIVKAGNSLTVNFTATDDPGDAVTVTDTLPTFATLNNLGNGSYSIALNPTTANLGSYNASVTATDQFGATTYVPFTISVVETNVSSIYVHFSTDTSILPAPWNNFHGYPFANLTLSNLIRTDGTSSGASVSILEQWSDPPGEYGMSTGDNSGIFPDVVSRSTYKETTTNTRHIKFTGLDVTKKYSVAVLCSVNSGQNATATVTVGNQTQNYSACYNVDSTAQFNGIHPASDGSLTIGFNKGTGAVGYLNAILLQAYDSTVVPIISPNFVYAEPFFNTKTALKVHWADRSDNETGFQIFRSTSATGTFTQVGTAAAKATSFTDNGLQPNTQYFYQVRAVKNGAQSDFSNTCSAVTPAMVVLEHTTWHMPESIKPWNNTGVNPQVGDRYANLIDDQQHNTGIALNVLSTFLGEYNGGMTSGNNSYVFPDSVMASCFYVQLAMPPAVLVLDGLDQTKVYRIGFSGSANLNENLTGAMTINGVTKTFNADGNTFKVIYFDRVVPDGNGTVTITFSASGLYGLLNALVIEGYTRPTSTGIPVDNAHSSAVKQGVQSANAAAFNDSTATPDLKGFVAYPNPFRDGFSISWVSDQSGAGKHLEIDVLNLTGQMIYRQDAGYVNEGRYAYSVNLPQSTPVGTYIVVVKENGAEVKSFKMIKVR